MSDRTDKMDRWTLVKALEAAEAQRDTLAEALAERDERLHRIHMFFENLSLRGILNIATEDALAGVASPEERP